MGNWFKVRLQAAGLLRSEKREPPSTTFRVVLTICELALIAFLFVIDESTIGIAIFVGLLVGWALVAFGKWRYR